MDPIPREPRDPSRIRERLETVIACVEAAAYVLWIIVATCCAATVVVSVASGRAPSALSIGVTATLAALAAALTARNNGRRE